MALISIKEYAQRNGLLHDNVRHKCQRGTYKTAQKIGRDWLIDENEPDNDRRVKTGAYVGRKRKKLEGEKDAYKKEELEPGSDETKACI